VARVRIRPGSGNIRVNNRTLDDYFPNEEHRKIVLETLEAVERRDSVDVIIRVRGGGSTGQAGACRMGIARALCSYDMGLFQPLRDNGFLTRDARMKERKKYGLHGARRGVQFSKR
jgi:small subunit ribosomal protein S9